MEENRRAAGTLKNWGGCTKVGSDTLNRRSAVKYEGVSSKGKGYIWVNTKLRCVVKTEDTGGGIEFHNIQEGSQPASLFEVPTGYTKFEMGAMMGQRQLALQRETEAETSGLDATRFCARDPSSA